MSEGTVSLIRNLLVLQPNRRLSAEQLLDSLACIVTTFKVPKVIGEEEQVVPCVPEFDEQQTREKEAEKKDGERKNEKAKPVNDFIRQITLQVNA